MSESAGHILIADDDPACSRTTQLLLAREGYACECVPDADAAARSLAAQSFDLLISDINMPGNAGLELIRKVPQVVEGLPVILLTGDPTVETAVQSIRLSVVGYLVKPADSDELRALVRQSVANYRAFRSVSQSRRRLVEWAQDLEKIEEVIRRAPASGAAPMNSYLGVTLHNLLLILVDWKKVMDSTPSALAGAEGHNAEQVVGALRETIQVLERTKQSFKSRELGELRKKLEELLNKARETPANGAKAP